MLLSSPIYELFLDSISDLLCDYSNFAVFLFVFLISVVVLSKTVVVLLLPTTILCLCSNLCSLLFIRSLIHDSKSKSYSTTEGQNAIENHISFNMNSVAPLTK